LFAASDLAKPLRITDRRHQKEGKNREHFDAFLHFITCAPKLRALSIPA
jgi:hypothetical protein